jgi:hypothetical protein
MTPQATSEKDANKKKALAEKTKPTRKKRPLAQTAAIDVEVDENAEYVRRARLFKLIQIEALAIAVLSGILVLGTPFFRPIYQYYALDTQQNQKKLVALTMPNMTNRAVLSWATIGITEIMTMGFGDYLPHLNGQRYRFTPSGWESFSKAFDKQKIGQAFKKSQLVLTTVPSDTAVITKQGENERHVYEWHVQMPVIMTYATNNNVTRRESSFIELTIIRVSPAQNPGGIAIESWSIVH